MPNDQSVCDSHITDEQIEKAIDKLVEQGRVIRITMLDGKPGVRLIKRDVCHVN